MLWGVFCEKGLSKLAIIVVNQNAAICTDTPHDYLLPFARRVYSTKWIFQQDTASIHTASVAKNWFKENNIDVMQWPSRSADPNRTENIWGVLSPAVYAGGKQFKDVGELKTCVLEEWNRLRYELLYDLNRSMAKCCADVITNHDAKISY